jgi:hypothetical protein
MSDELILAVLTDIRNWIRASSHALVGKQLDAALPDAKSRAAYQMLDGTTSLAQVRLKCKLSPNVVVSLAQRCVAMGLMEVNDEKMRVRLFDLTDFGLVDRDQGHIK